MMESIHTESNKQFHKCKQSLEQVHDVCFYNKFMMSASTTSS